MKAPLALAVISTGLVITTAMAAQTWEPLTNQPSFNPGAMLLLTDGTVIMHSEPNCLTCTSTDYSSWYKLTPDINGSYVNGTWTQVASLPSGYAPLYFGSAVLPDGRLIVEGGEYNCASGSCNAVCHVAARPMRTERYERYSKSTPDCQPAWRRHSDDNAYLACWLQHATGIKAFRQAAGIRIRAHQGRII